MLAGWGATTRVAFGDTVAEGKTGLELYHALQEARGQLAQVAYATYGCNFDEAAPVAFQTLFDRIAALSQLEVHLGTDYTPEDGDVADAIAAEFHRQYEMRAYYHGYKTRPASAVPWPEVPEQNKALMREVVSVLLDEGIVAVGHCLEQPQPQTLYEEYGFEGVEPPPVDGGAQDAPLDGGAQDAPLDGGAHDLRAAMRQGALAAEHVEPHCVSQGAPQIAIARRLRSV